MLHSCCWQYRRVIIRLLSSNRAWRLLYSWKSNHLQVEEWFLSVCVSDSLFCPFPLFKWLKAGPIPLPSGPCTHANLSGFRGIVSKSLCLLVRKEESVEGVRVEAACLLWRAQTRALRCFPYRAHTFWSRTNCLGINPRRLQYWAMPKNLHGQASLHRDDSNYRWESGVGTLSL